MRLRNRKTTIGVESCDSDSEDDTPAYVPGSDDDSSSVDDGEDTVELFRSSKKSRNPGAKSNAGPRVEGVLLDNTSPAKYHYTRGSTEGHAMAESRARREYEQRKTEGLEEWVKTCATIRVDNVTLDQLETRSKGTKLMAAAQTDMERFERDMEQGKVGFIGTSALVTDKDGNMLVSCFGHRERGTTMEGPRRHEVCRVSCLTVYELIGCGEFTSEDDLKTYLKDKDVAWDGLEEHTLLHAAWETQTTAHIMGIKKKAKDNRHRLDNGLGHRYQDGLYIGDKKERMRFESDVPPPTRDLGTRNRADNIYKARCDGVRHCARRSKKAGKKVYYDRVGVLHFDRGWIETGKENGAGRIGVSADLMGGCSYKSGAAMRYMANTNKYLQEVLTPHLVACAPKEYRAMRNAYRAASLNTADEDAQGFHTGQAIVYNEVVHQHVDGADSGLCITFCTGPFRGGWIYFPDLKMAFYYGPGTVLVFRSSALYHGVTQWWPVGGIDRYGITPGRVAYVFYTKKTPFDVLKGKVSGWLRRTAYGTMPITYDTPRVSEGNPVFHAKYYQKLRSTVGNMLGKKVKKGRDIVRVEVPTLSPI